MHRAITFANEYTGEEKKVQSTTYHEIAHLSSLFMGNKVLKNNPKGSIFGYSFVLFPIPHQLGHVGLLKKNLFVGCLDGSIG